MISPVCCYNLDPNHVPGISQYVGHCVVFEPDWHKPQCRHKSLRLYVAVSSSGLLPLPDVALLYVIPTPKQNRTAVGLSLLQVWRCIFVFLCMALNRALPIGQTSDWPAHTEAQDQSKRVVTCEHDSLITCTCYRPASAALRLQHMSCLSAYLSDVRSAARFVAPMECPCKNSQRLSVCVQLRPCF